MTLKTKYRLLTWLVVVLAASNIAMGLSYWFYSHQADIQTGRIVIPETDLPAQQRTRFFREQLNLSPVQVDKFRALNRDFNQKAWELRIRMTELRLMMVSQMGRETPDLQQLDSISSQIGALHKQLKDETINYYLSMKNLSNDEQKKKLHEIFLSVLEENDEIRLPEGRSRFRNYKYNNSDL